MLVQTGLLLIAAAFCLNYWGALNLDLVIIIHANVFIVSAFIIRNQANIDRVFLKMNRQLAGVTRNLSRFNIISVISLLTITALLFNFKKIVIFIIIFAKYIALNLMRFT